MASGRKAGTGSTRESRETRERSRIYQARIDLNARQVRRRVRDNVVAGVVGGLLVLGAVGAMTAYYAAGPGVPAVTPTTPATPVPGSPAPLAPEAPVTEAPATPAPTTTPAG